MKKTFLLVMPAAAMVVLWCQEKELPSAQVPGVVVKGWTTRYPGGKNVEWHRTRDENNGMTVYDATFQYFGKTIRAQFDSSSHFIQEQ